MNPVIQIKDLTVRYGSKEVVSNLNLEVLEGSVYAFLGTNGAGKTTTIKTLLNLLKPSGGKISVLGTPVARLGPKELAQIGYLSGDQTIPPTLTVQELINYSSAIYPTWDNVFCRHLIELLRLPLNRKFSHLSKGMKLKAVLLLALAYRPRLLILDEPFGGLDPLVRDEFIQSLLEVMSQEQWTVFISSHDMAEVELLATWVGILDQGTLWLSEPLETVRTRFRRIDITLPDGATLGQAPPPVGLLFEAAEGSARWIEAHFVSENQTAQSIRERFPAGTVWAITPLSLRDIFVAVTRAVRQNPKAGI